MLDLDLIFVDRDVGTIGSDSDLAHKGNGRVSPVLILGDDGEGGEAGGPPTQGCQDIGAGALEVKFSTIEGVIVGVTPQPAGGLGVRDADALAVLNFACLLFQAGHAPAGICGNEETGLRPLPHFPHISQLSPSVCLPHLCASVSLPVA
uniref:Uncharacterized protein n=1 Tax=Vombatus ursinus TaxID=29139 RepID=A0A4X2MAL7_VOMUR